MSMRLPDPAAATHSENAIVPIKPTRATERRPNGLMVLYLFLPGKGHVGDSDA